MTEDKSKALKFNALLPYSFIALPIAFAGYPIYIIIPDYYASEYGLSLTSLAAILLVLRVIDGVQAPFIGYFSDRFSSYRLEAIILACFCLLAGFILLFIPLVKEVLLIWFCATLFLVTTAYSHLVINITALGSIWPVNAHERTRISIYRERFGLIGLLLAVSLPSLIGFYHTPHMTFVIMAFILTCLLGVGLFSFIIWYRKFSDHIEWPPQRLRYSNLFANLFKLSAKIRRFFLIYGISMLSSSIPAVLIIFFVRDYLQAPSYIGLFLTLYFLTAAIGMPFWLQVSRSLNNKEKCWGIAMSLAIFSFAGTLLLETGDIAGFAIVCLFSGFAFGAELALPPSILGDHMINQRQQKQSALLTAQLTFLTKVSLAVSTIFVFPLLEQFGFRPAQKNTDVALNTLLICYGALPIAIKLIGIGLLIRDQTRADFVKEF